jgi:heptosyltransferase-2
MALPAIAADGADVMVRGWLVPLFAMAGLPARILPLAHGWAGFRDAVGRLRAAGYSEGVLMTPSFSAAWLFRWGGVGRLRGTASDGRSFMLSERIPRTALSDRHRINQFKLLLGQDPDTEARNHPLRPPREEVDRWRSRLGEGRPVVGFFPGSNAPARRWAPGRFAEVARALAGRDVRTVVMGGEGEREITAQVVSGAPGALDAGGATGLPGLAALLSVCDLVVTNDTGPMHLAGAVGTPTVTLWGPSDPGEVHPVGADDQRVAGPALPCRPCFKNQCPRRGEGTLLTEAYEECMQLISVDDVVDAAVRILDGAAP